MEETWRKRRHYKIRFRLRRKIMQDNLIISISQEHLIEISEQKMYLFPTTLITNHTYVFFRLYLYFV